MLIAQLSDLHVGGARHRRVAGGGHAAGALVHGFDVAHARVHERRLQRGPVEPERIAIELRIPGGQGQSLGEYPRTWPVELSSRHAEPFVPAEHGRALAND
jgi:hypothetical protein